MEVRDLDVTIISAELELKLSWIGKMKVLLLGKNHHPAVYYAKVIVDNRVGASTTVEAEEGGTKVEWNQKHSFRSVQEAFFRSRLSNVKVYVYRVTRGRFHDMLVGTVFVPLLRFVGKEGEEEVVTYQLESIKSWPRKQLASVRSVRLSVLVGKKTTIGPAAAAQFYPPPKETGGGGRATGAGTGAAGGTVSSDSGWDGGWDGCDSGWDGGWS